MRCVRFSIAIAGRAALISWVRSCVIGDMRRPSFLALALVLTATSASAQLQDPSESPAPGREAPVQVDEITVTGARSDVTDIQSEAQAISAFSMEELDRANIVNVDQLAFNVPALHVGQQGSDSIITLRGISTENATITGEPGVAFHIDGVSYGRPAAARVAFFDLEGLQVLRGPQGSLGGKNSTAGWIHATTRKPTADFSAKTDVQWGSYNQRRWRGALNIPLNESVQTRFAFTREDRQGFQRNLLFDDRDRDAFDTDDFGWRAHLRAIPSDSFEILTTFNYYEAKGNGVGAEIVPLEPEKRCNPFPPPFGTGFNPLTRFPSFAGCPANPLRTDTQGRPAPVYAATGFDLERQARFLNFENPETLGDPRSLAERASSVPHEVYLNDSSSQENTFWGWTTTADWDAPTLPLLGDTQLNGILAYQVTDLDSSGDFDGTDIPIFTARDSLTDTDQQTAQLQWLGGGWDGLLDWQGSLFVARETSERDTLAIVRLATLVPLRVDQTAENTSYGVALSTTWGLLDNLSLTLGGRYIKDVKRNKILRNNPSDTENSFGSRIAVCTGGARDVKGLLLPNGRERADGKPDDGNPTCESSYRQTTGDLTLEWWPEEESLLYAKVANGFKAGGFAQGQSGEYKPEKIWSFSLGSKNTFFDDRLTANLEYYFYNYRDLQLVLVDGIAFRTDNADAEIQGLDLEFQAEPLPGLRFNGNGSWLDSEFTQYLAVDPVDVIVAANCRTLQVSLDPNPLLPDPGCAPSDWSGNELSRAPQWSFTLGAEYEIYLGRFGTLTPRVQYYWQDDTWYRPFNRTAENSGDNTPCPIPNAKPQSGCDQGKLLNAAEARDLQEAYHFTDFKLIWRSPSEGWTAEAFLQNLENEVVYQNVLTGTPLLSSPQLAWYGNPRVYGFRVGFRY